MSDSYINAPMAHLYSNDAASAAFPSQTISAAFSQFNAIYIVFYGYTGYTNVSDAIIRNDGKGHTVAYLDTPLSGAAGAYTRTFEIQGDTLVVSNGRKKALPDGDRTDDNNVIVPYRIYGIR